MEKSGKRITRVDFQKRWMNYPLQRLMEKE